MSSDHVSSKRSASAQQVVEMHLVNTVVPALTPLLAEEGFELVDVECESVGSDLVVRILVDLLVDSPPQSLTDADVEAPPSRGPFGRIDLEGVSAATRLIDAYLDAADPIEQAFTLEVSSPGLERPLRTPQHFARFIGTEVSIKTVAGTPGERRLSGILMTADPSAAGSITVTDRPHVPGSGRSIAYADIDRARTVFRWGEETGPQAAPTPSGQPRKKGALPKGQRPVHPKARQASPVEGDQSDAAGRPPDSSTPAR